MKSEANNRCSAIIPYEGGIILIKRVVGYGKDKKEYYTIPGGGQDEGETTKEGSIREIKEEIGIDIALREKVYIINTYGRTQYFYIGEYIRGKIGSGTGEEMTNSNYEKYGSYNIEIINKKDIKNINLLPVEIKDIILRDMNDIF